MRTQVLVAACVAVVLLLGCSNSDDDGSETVVVGLVTNNSNGLANISGFQDGMSDLGYVEGRNVSYVFSGNPVNSADLEATFLDMVEREVDLIFTAGTPTGVAAHAATRETEIPVVFGVIADPIAAGVMQDLTTPGGNMTGVRLSENQGRRLQLLLDLAPDIERIWVPHNPDDSAAADAVNQLTSVAGSLGVELVAGFARTDEEVVEAIRSIPMDIDAIFMVPDSVVNARIENLVDLAIERKLPLSGPSMIQVEQGALTAYGIIHREAGRQASAMADLILKGAQSGALPVQTAEAFLGLNLNTARIIGLDVTPDLVQQAEFIVPVAD